VARYTADDRPADANQRFLSQLYLDLLHRPIDAAGRAAFGAYLGQGGSRQLVAQAILASREYQMLVVRSLYSSLLRREADPSGLSAFADFLGAGGTVAQVRAVMLSSQEYYQGRAGSTNDGFVAALYRDALNRAVDPGGRQAFGQALVAGVSRFTVAAVV